jgi:hypothetical protein
MRKEVITKAMGFAASSVVVLSTAFLAATPVFAQYNYGAPSTTATSPAPTPSLRPGQIMRQDLKNDIGTMRQTIRSDRAKIHADRLARRFSFYTQRLTNIATRIQTNIDNQKAAGKDVTSAQTQLTTAKATLASATADGNTAVSMFNAITVEKWDQQQPQIKAAITQAQKARSEFVQARQQLIAVVQLLKK